MATFHTKWHPQKRSAKQIDKIVRTWPVIMSPTTYLALLMIGCCWRWQWQPVATFTASTVSGVGVGRSRQHEFPSYFRIRHGHICATITHHLLASDR